MSDTNFNDEQLKAIQAAIEHDLDRAFYNEGLKDKLQSLPTFQLDAIFANIVANAGYGQRTMVRQRVNALQRAVRDIPVPEGHKVSIATKLRHSLVKLRLLSKLLKRQDERLDGIPKILGSPQNTCNRNGEI